MPLLAALGASLQGGWPTCWGPPRSLDLSDLRRALGPRLRPQRLAGLVPEPARAAARLLEVGPAEVLALADLVTQVGRALGQPWERQVGLLVGPGNPYGRWCLLQLAQDPETFLRRGRWLVPGVPRPAALRRHLALALRELEGVGAELAVTFPGGDGHLAPALADLVAQQAVAVREVRFLDQGGRLRVDRAYRGLAAVERVVPLDTVGEVLIPVTVRGAGAPLWRIDPERATGLAYPGRVLRRGGRSYRINPWPAPEAARLLSLGGLGCSPTDDPALTWPIGEPRLTRVEPADGGGPAARGPGGLTRLPIQARYAEEVSGVLSWRPGLGGRGSLDQSLWGEPVTGTGYPVEGLLLGHPAAELADDPAGLHSAALALAQVLVVEVGVEEDALRVMAAEGLRLGGRRLSGLAILDLCPSGIGLAAALNTDALWPRLLLATRDWLAQCPCGSEPGCPLCLQSPPSLAATRGTGAPGLSRRQAVAVLNRLLGG